MIQAKNLTRLDQKRNEKNILNRQLMNLKEHKKQKIQHFKGQKNGR